MAIDHRVLAGAARNGLWRAMTDRVCPGEPLQVVEVAELAPRPSMFDYDPARAELLIELPELW